MTIVNKMEVDHGMTVPIKLMFGKLERIGLAMPGDSARGQRRAVSTADRPSLLHARQGDP